uniref:Uncharacterized protein LOC114324683 n=1 Tax=Diabrotica virgifera virgifera TaxID=50390 RepID=A0A6P7GTK7_DIAVI
MINALSSSDSSSNDEDIINFIVHLVRPRRVPRFHNRRYQYNYWDDVDFFRRFRLLKPTVLSLLEQIDGEIRSPTVWNHALNPMEMLLITLRYFATGSFLVVMGDFGGIHKSTTSKVIFKVGNTFKICCLSFLTI